MILLLQDCTLKKAHRSDPTSEITGASFAAWCTVLSRFRFVSPLIRCVFELAGAIRKSRLNVVSGLSDRACCHGPGAAQEWGISGDSTTG